MRIAATTRRTSPPRLVGTAARKQNGVFELAPQAGLELSGCSEPVELTQPADRSVPTRENLAHQTSLFHSENYDFAVRC